MTESKLYCSPYRAGRCVPYARQSSKTVSGEQEHYLHTHSHSKLAWRKTEEEEDEEEEVWDGKVIMESGLKYEGLRREKQ